MLKCVKCEIFKPESDYNFRNDIGKYRKECKKCTAKVKKNTRIKNILENNEKLQTIDKTQIKTCSSCKKDKQLSEFSINKGSKCGFYNWCLMCSRKKDNTRKKKDINIMKQV